MTRRSRKTVVDIIAGETGTILKNWTGRLRVALVYPNTYSVGMSNLGYQTVYRLINQRENVVCERVFLPDRSATQVFPRSIESGRPLRDFDIIAFSISFESDYSHLLEILQTSAVPLTSRERSADDPLVAAGGVACMLNPEPLAAFIDCFFIGEGEALIDPFFDRFDPERDRREMLKVLAREVPGVYVPMFYEVQYHEDGTLRSFTPVESVPAAIERGYARDLSSAVSCTAILSPHTTFDRTYLIEVGRGCPHGCRFCAAGYVYRPPRFQSLEHLKAAMAAGVALTDKIGLVGAAVSDVPGISSLCAAYRDADIRISFSSLRADALSPELLETLRQSRVKTATIAPDAGSERMRQVINKGVDEAAVLSAAETLVAEGIPNLKLYFMVGLPTETPADVDAVVTLCKRIKHRFLASSRTRGRMGEITVSLNSFVPKPMTPFQWAPMDDPEMLKRKIKRIKDGLKRIPNMRLHHDVPRHAYIQALLSRGDRRVASILMGVLRNGGNWVKTLKSSPVNADFFVLRARKTDEILPWDFIDHGISRSFLENEYHLALKGKASPPCPMADACRLCGVCT
ncbi:TIGR03960 family B12-binding radical SAM protein [Desulfococcus multivorans]|uniref:TIGR03960 family B12-binding radical SAM protein n=1 Tax=Desulfococcus multivorans TaxID=897 RepID=UPI000400405E|nr:TIGR03960 family B12-binding radical SAM protein [Desulfococcus multivorans]AOY59543.1 radical SAM domain protein [Desulfococcus multivorans]AQV01738.1 B12-binding protein [Desulfococcus multivorans]